MGTDVSVGHLTAAEADGNLDLVPGLEEARGIAYLDVHVVVVGLGTKLDLFELNLHLVTAGCRLLLLAVVFHPTVVGDATHRRPAIGGHLDEVEPAILRKANGIFREKLTKTIPFVVDYEHPGYADTLVDSWLIIFWTEWTSGTTGSAQRVSPFVSVDSATPVWCRLAKLPQSGQSVKPKR